MLYGRREGMNASWIGVAPLFLVRVLASLGDFTSASVTIYLNLALAGTGEQRPVTSLSNSFL